MLPSTITDDIEKGKTAEINHRKLTNELIIRYGQTDERIALPINSVIAKYRDFFEPIIGEVELSEDDQNRYRFAPKKFCQDVYGDQGYWSMLLYINECHSVLDFDLKRVKYFDPLKFQNLLQEVLINAEIN